MSRTFRRKNIVQPTIKNWIESKLPNRRYYIWYRDAIRLYRELDNSENKNIVIKKAENVYKRDGVHFDKIENHSKYYRNYTERRIRQHNKINIRKNLFYDEEFINSDRLTFSHIIYDD